MSKPRLIELCSAAELRQAASAWDDLWQRSEVANPTARAALVAGWLEHFAPRRALRALVVEVGGSFVVALPLVERRVKGLVDLAALPGNPWSSAGELLIDPAAGSEALDCLAAALPRLPWPLLWLDGVNPDSPAWRLLLPVLKARGMATEYREVCRVGLVEPGGSWEEYQARWSKNHRKNVRRTWQRLAEAGPSELVWSRPAEGAVEPLLRRALEVEERSWKRGVRGTVLESPGIYEFFRDQACQLAAWEMLDLSLLEHSGRPIAFEYGYTAKGTYFSHKVGYDETFAAFGPGQLLMGELLRRMHEENHCRRVDCLGPLSQAVSRWTTGSYSQGRLVVAPRGLLGRVLLGAYRAYRPVRRRQPRSERE